MFVLLKDVPVVNHPVFRIVLGAVLIAAGLALHNNIIILAIGAFLLVMGLVRGVSILTGHTQKEQAR